MAKREQSKEELRAEIADLYEKREYKKVLYRLKKMSERHGDDGYCINLLGNMYYYGKGVAQSQKRAFEQYARAEKLNFPNAIVNLGTMYDFGEYVKKDVEKAMEYYQRGIDLGNAYALVRMGNVYYHGRQNFITDYQKAIEYYKMAVEKGSPYGMLQLSECYRYGNGVERSLDEAERLLLASFELGSNTACERLADLYSGRYSIGWSYSFNPFPKEKVDHKKAVMYLKILADKGDAVRANQLAEYYYKDEYKNDIEPNIAEAYKYLSLSAEKNEYMSKRFLNRVKSDGVTEPFCEDENDKEIARFQELLAHNTDDVDMKRVSAFRRAFGVSVEENGEMALRLYKELYELKDIKGAYQYGFCYAHGIGTEPNENKAIEIWKIASELGSEEAKESLRLRQG